MAGRSWVDANYRFIAAYQEVNARIAQRQQALALYVTLVVSILAAGWRIYPERIAANPFILWLVIGCSTASLLALLLSSKWSFRPEA